MKLYHTFVDRNYILWKSTRDAQITEEDRRRLLSFGLKASIMDDVPEWLYKWASLTCAYIEFEVEIYPEVLKNDFPNLTISDLVSILCFLS